MGFIADSCLIIDLEREIKKGDESGRAHQHFASHHIVLHQLTFTVAGELAAGAQVSGRSGWERFLQAYPVLEWSKEIAWKYGELHIALRSQRKMIGANDLWIAATALVHAMPVVTRNIDEFSRVPDLEVVPY